MAPYILAATAHYRVAAAIAVGAYRVWLKLPWWIAAMRASITNDEAKAERARKALDAIDPQRH